MRGPTRSAKAGRRASAPRPRVGGAGTAGGAWAERPRHQQLTRQWAAIRALEASPDGLTWRELARMLGAGMRTVFRDLHTLQGAGFGVEQAVVRGRPVWRLRPGPGSTGGSPPVRFTAAELAALALARQMVGAAPGSPFDTAMRGAFRKIESACDREGIRVIETTDRRLHADRKRGRPYTDSSVWFATILDALHRSRTVRIRYWTLERDAVSDREVDPWGLVLHEGGFYLVGWCHDRRAARTFLVDRIRSAVVTDKAFEPPAGFSAEVHFKDAWGLIRDKALETATIRFTGTAARRVKESRWHPSQRIEPGPDGATDLTVRVAGLDEIVKWVLSWAGQAEVLRPGSLRDAVRAASERMRDRHAGGRHS